MTAILDATSSAGAFAHLATALITGKGARP